MRPMRFRFLARNVLLFAPLLTLSTAVDPAPLTGQSEGGATKAALADSTWIDRAVAVRMTRGSTRQLEWELFLPSSTGAVWRAWTVPTEMTTWAGPGAEIDLQPGGIWEVHFNPGRPPGQRGSDANSIVAVIPGRELHLRAGAPLDFPTVREAKTDFAVRIEPAGFGHTRVVVVQKGWEDGEEWDRAFEYLAGANAEWLNWLHQRFVEGPLQWPGGG